MAAFLPSSGNSFHDFGASFRGYLRVHREIMLISRPAVKNPLGSLRSAGIAFACGEI